MVDKKEIKLRAHELCRQFLANRGSVKERNTFIIEKLMEEFNISRELAEECFNKNNETE